MLKLAVSMVNNNYDMFFIFFFLVVCLLINFKKTVIIFTPFKFMIMNGVILYGNITFDNAISLIICVLFICKFSKYCKKSIKWPLVLPFLIIIISESIGAIIANPNYISIPLKICRNYGFCVVLFYLINNKKDFCLLIKSLMLFVTMLVVNGVFEFFFNINLIGDWISQYITEKSFFIDKTDYGSRGLRVHSFLAHSICFGNVCAIFLFIFLFLKNKKIHLKYDALVILLLIIGVIISNSRTPLLALLIYLCPFIYVYSKNPKYRKYVVMLLIFCLIFLGDTLYRTFDSMFNENSKFAVGGSNMSMRLLQLSTTFYLIRNSLFFGLGYSFDFTIYEDLCGAESIWFNLLMYNGLFGAFAYLFIFYNCIFKIRDKNKLYIVFMSLGYLVQQTATYNAGLNDSLFYVCLIIVICYSRIYDIGNNDTYPLAELN